MRIMTVHRSKGLEFPIVILADPTCRLHRATAERHIDPKRGLCALRLGGWQPLELLDHEASKSSETERRASVWRTLQRPGPETSWLFLLSVMDHAMGGGRARCMLPSTIHRDPEVSGARAPVSGIWRRFGPGTSRWRPRVPGDGFPRPLPFGRRRPGQTGA